MIRPTPGPWSRDGTHVMGSDNQVVAVCRQAKPRNTCEAIANAALIAVAPDYAIVAAAMTAGIARWEATTSELCFDGMRYSTKLDAFGVPMLNELTRPLLARIEGRS